MEPHVGAQPREIDLGPDRNETREPDDREREHEEEDEPREERVVAAVEQRDLGLGEPSVRTDVVPSEPRDSHGRERDADELGETVAPVVHGPRMPRVPTGQASGGGRGPRRRRRDGARAAAHASAIAPRMIWNAVAARGPSL